MQSSGSTVSKQLRIAFFSGPAHLVLERNQITIKRGMLLCSNRVKIRQRL